MQSTKPQTVDEYISGFDGEVQSRLKQLRDVFKETYPKVEETIRYNMPAFKLGKEHLYIAGYKKHIGMYPVYGLPELESELIAYRVKGTKDALHFTHTRPLPIALIRKIIIEKTLPD